MSFSFSDLIDFSKIPIKIFILFSIVSGILLFGTHEFLDQLKLVELEKDYGKYSGIIFIVCISFIVLSIIYYFIEKINNLIYQSKVKQEIIEDIKNLDPSEQSVLREFYILRRATISMPMDNPVISGLIQKYILVRKSNIATAMYCPMGLSNVARRNLKDIDLGLRENMTELEQKTLVQARPKWSSDFIYKNEND